MIKKTNIYHKMKHSDSEILFGNKMTLNINLPIT